MSHIKIKLTKSLVGQNKRRVAIANSLGLRKMNSSTTQPDNDATRGKVRRINDLVSLEEIDNSADAMKTLN